MKRRFGFLSLVVFLVVLSLPIITYGFTDMKDKLEEENNNNSKSVTTQALAENKVLRTDIQPIVLSNIDELSSTAKSRKNIVSDNLASMNSTSFHISSTSYTDGFYTYTVSGTNATITGYSGSETDITIPSSLGGYTVNAIAPYAFNMKISLINVVIPKGIAAIGDLAFSGCTNLKSVSFTYNDLTDFKVSIGGSVFGGCTSLTSVSLVDNITSIGYDAFYNCTSLVSLSLPKNLEILGYRFIEGTGISSITIPKTLKTAGGYGYDGPLAGAGKLTAVILEDGMTKIPSFLLSTASSKPSYVNEVVIPDTVTTIGSYAFSNCTALTSITLSPALSVVENGVFFGCTGITDIILPKTVSQIYDAAFSGCTNLKSVAFTYNDLTDFKVSIGGSVFGGCTSLSSVSLVDNITSIGDNAFYNCNSLTSLNLPKNLETLGYRFIEGTGVSSITIPKTLKTAGSYGYDGPLAGAGKLTTVILEEGMIKVPSFLHSTASSKPSYVTKVVMPNTVTTIGSYAFSNCTALTSITLSSALSVVENGVFSGCTGITDIILPKTVSQIYDAAFSGCTNLKSVSFTYNDLTDFKVSIGGSVFGGCTSLTSVSLVDNITSIGYDAFYNCTNLVSLSLPKSLEILGYRFIEGTGISSITIPKTLKTAGGYGYDGPLAGAGKLTTVILEEGMTKVPSFLLSTASSKPSYLTKVIMPDTVTTIGSYAFSNCTALTSITLSPALSVVENGVFSGCTGITDIILPKTVSQIYDAAFSGCTNLKSVAFTYNELTDFKMSIGGSVFGGCTSLTSVSLVDNITSIGDNAFYNCTSLVSLTLPKNLETLGYRFIEGTGITCITIPKTLKTAGGYGYDGPLAGAGKLTTVILEDGMTKIPSFLLSTASSKPSYVTKVVIPDTVTTIENNAFYNCIGFTIYGYTNSYAETYAKDNNIPFTPVAISKNATADEVLGKLNVNNLIGDISISGTTIHGPYVEIAGDKFYLFSFDASSQLKISDKVHAEVDTTTKTIKLVIGLQDYKGSASLNGTDNKTTYWSESYQQVKSLYQNMTGNKVSTTKLWNDFSALRGKLKPTDGTFGVSINGKKYLAGYIEFSYSSGDIVLSDGGLIAELGLGASIDYKVPAFPAAYLTFGLNGSLKGQMKFVLNSTKYTPEFKTTLAMTASVGVGLGDKKLKTYVEGGLKGILSLGMLYPASSIEEMLTAKLSADVYIDSKVIGWSGPSYSHTFASTQLYPYNETKTASIKSEKINSEDKIQYNFEWDKAKPIGRDYLSNKKMKISSLTGNSSFTKTNLYPYNAPQLVGLPDGKKMMVWVDDDGTKSAVNRTNLMYSVFNGSTWSESKVIAASAGLNDYPYVVSDSDGVYIVWQRANQAMSDDASFTEVLSNVDLYYTKYTNGSFSEVVPLTSGNTDYEMMQVMAVNGNEKAVAWVENSENDPFLSKGTNSLHLMIDKGNGWDEQTIISGSDSIDNVVLSYVDNKLYVAYEKGVSQGEVYLYSEGLTKEIGNDGDRIGNIMMSDGKLFFVKNSSLNAYDLSTGSISDQGIAVNGEYDIITNGLNKVLLTTKTDGYHSKLVAYRFSYASNSWSDEIDLTDDESYIRNFSACLNKADGSLSVSVNSAVVNDTVTNGELYGSATLKVLDCSSNRKLTMGDQIYYDYNSVARGAILPLKFDVINNGMSDVNKINVKIIGEDGTELQSGTVNVVIASGETTQVQYDYKLPDNLVFHKVTVIVSADGEADISDNSREVSIGYADLCESELTLSGTALAATIKGTVINNGYDTTKNVMVTAYAGSNKAEVIGTYSLSDLTSGASEKFMIQLPEKYLNTDSMTAGNMIFVEVSSDAEESRYENNSQNLLIKSSVDEPIRLSNSYADLSVGNTKKIYLSYAADGWNNDVSIEWSSSDESVVTVSNGVLSAHAAGKAVITAKYNGKEAICNVTVTGTKVNSVSLDSCSKDIMLGNAMTLTASILPLNADNTNLTWSSDDESVVTVNEKGVVTPVSVGTACITAITEDGYKTASCKIKVIKDLSVLHSISFSGGSGATGIAPATISAYAGDTITLPGNTFTFDGMTFAGWSDGVAVYSEKDSYTIGNSNVTFIAKWRVNQTDQSPVSSATPVPNMQTNPTLPENKVTSGNKAMPAIGTVYINGSVTYKVTKSEAMGGTATVIKVRDTVTVNIPATVLIDGMYFKVTGISKNALKNNKKLKTVTIGDYVTNIETGSFYGCKKLKKVTFGKGLKRINTKAFYQCKQLKWMIFKGNKLDTVGKGAFKGIYKKPTIIVPKQKKIYKVKYKKALKKGNISTRAIYR